MQPTKKRYRAPKSKPGVLRIYYGRADGDGPDVCVQWGEGVHRGNAGFLLSAFTADRLVLDLNAPCHHTWGTSLIKELEERGFDITTLKLSIEKKRTKNCKDCGKPTNRRERFERCHECAAKHNHCGGYCENPENCCGGCYEY